MGKPRPFPAPGVRQRFRQGRPWSPLPAFCQGRKGLFSLLSLRRDSQGDQANVIKWLYRNLVLFPNIWREEAYQTAHHLLPLARSCRIHSRCRDRSQLQHCCYSADSWNAPDE